jgi:hypothetical protein
MIEEVVHVLVIITDGECLGDNDYGKLSILYPALYNQRLLWGRLDVTIVAGSEEKRKQRNNIIEKLFCHGLEFTEITERWQYPQLQFGGSISKSTFVVSTDVIENLVALAGSVIERKIDSILTNPASMPVVVDGKVQSYVGF